MTDDLAAYLYELATTGMSDETRARVMLVDAAHALEAGGDPDLVVARLVLECLPEPWGKRLMEAWRSLALAQSPGRGSARSPDISVTAGPVAEPSSPSVRQES